MSSIPPPSSPSSSGGAPAGVGLMMIGPQPQAPVQVPDWIGTFAGLNQTMPANRLGEWECADIQNLLIGSGSLKLRAGRTAVLNTLTATTWVAHGGHRVYSLGATAYDYIAGAFAGAGAIKTSRSGAWADLMGYVVGADNRVEFVAAKNAVYIFFGHVTTNPVKVTGADSVVTTAWAATVKPSMGVWHKKRLWTDDVLTAGRVRLSDTDDPDTMRAQTSATIVTQGGYIDFVIPDGDTIRAMASWVGRLVVMSERSIHIIDGSNFANMTITSVFGIGTKSPRSVRQCENDLWFLDAGGTVRFLSGSQPQITALVVSGVPGYYVETITQAISQANLPKVHAVYHNRRYWLFFPTSQALCWDFRELPVPGSRWASHTACPFGASWIAGAGGDADTIYILRDDTPRLCTFLTGATDEGAAIAYKWKSRAYDWYAPQWVKGLDRVAPQLLGVTGAVTINGYADLSGSTAFSEVLTYTGGAFERKDTGRVASAVQGQVVQIELTGATSTFYCAGIELAPTRKRRAV